MTAFFHHKSLIKPDRTCMNQASPPDPVVNRPGTGGKRPGGPAVRLRSAQLVDRLTSEVSEEPPAGCGRPTVRLTSAAISLGQDRDAVALGTAKSLATSLPVSGAGSWPTSGVPLSEPLVPVVRVGGNGPMPQLNPRIFEVAVTEPVRVMLVGPSGLPATVPWKSLTAVTCVGIDSSPRCRVKGLKVMLSWAMVETSPMLGSKVTSPQALPLVPLAWACLPMVTVPFVSVLENGIPPLVGQGAALVEAEAPTGASSIAASASSARMASQRMRGCVEGLPGCGRAGMRTNLLRWRDL